MNKRIARQAAAQFKRKAVCWSSDFEDKKVIITDILSGRLSNLNELDFFAVENMQHRWNIVMMVFCKLPGGQGYMHSDETQAPVYCKHHQLIDSLNEKHESLLDSVHKDHVVSTAWVATIPAISTEVAMRQIRKDPADWTLTRERELD